MNKDIPKLGFVVAAALAGVLPRAGAVDDGSAPAPKGGSAILAKAEGAFGDAGGPGPVVVGRRRAADAEAVPGGAVFPEPARGSAAKVPPVAGSNVPLTPEQEAAVIEASMAREKRMVGLLHAKVKQWTDDQVPPEEMERRLVRALEDASRAKENAELFGEARPATPAGIRLRNETMSAYAYRARQRVDPVKNPSREEIKSALHDQGRGSGAVESGGSAKEVFDKNKAAFEEVCKKYSDVPPRPILGIFAAETNFGQGCSQSKSGTCGTPSPASKGNGAQRNAALRIGGKGMFGSWSATTAPASPAAAAGICQFLPSTAETQLGALKQDFGKDSANLFAFDGCIPMTAIYLHKVMKEKGFNIDDAVKAYNGGPGFKGHEKAETTKYGKKVSGSMKGQTGVPESCAALQGGSGGR